MFPFVQQFLQSPDHHDPTERIKAHALHSVLIGTFGLIALFVVFAIPLVVVKKIEALGLCVILLLVSVVAMYLLRRGRTRKSSVVLLSAHWAVATLVIVLSGGIASPGFVYLYSLIVLTAWLLGSRAAAVAAGAVIVQSLILAILENTEIRPPRFFPAPPMAKWAVTVVSICIGSIAFSEYVSSLSRVLALLTVKVKALTRAEQALRESETNLRTIFELAPDGIFILDANDRFLEVNAAICRQLGYSSELLQTLRLTGVVAAPFRDAMCNLLAAASGSMECRFVRRDGAELPVEIQLSRIRFAGKSATIGTSRDTSERKRAEQEKQKLEEQLLQAQKLESIGRLAGGVAHDFNNLLTVINGYSTLLLNGPNVTASGRGQLEQIKKAGDRAADLTRQLLAFGRKQAVRPEPLDLNVEVRDLQAMIERLINEDIKLVTNLAPDLGHVWADPAHVQQVLVNLVVNARDALPKGGEIKIETTSVCLTENFLNGEPGAVPGDYVLLSVTDNGIGIDEDTLQHLFEPFFTTKERGKGTGLGLSTVYGIVRQNGGLVRVESEKGRGTVFKVYLPRAEAAEPALKEELGPQFAAGVETVLVAEDHDDVRSLMRNALEAQGYRVLDAASGREALAMEAGHAGPIHLLLTDVIMPGMNGPDLAQKLMIRRPGIKVLYVSGYTDNKIAPQEELGPAAEFLAKPFAPDVVVSRVRKLLGHDVLRG